MRTRREIECFLRVEGFWLRKITEEIVTNDLSPYSLRLLGLALFEYGLKSRAEHRKATRLHQALVERGFKAQLAKGRESSHLERRIAERLRADLEKRLDLQVPLA